MPTIKERVAALQKQILDQDYYVAEWLRCLNQKKMTPASVDRQEHDERKLVLVCNHFWMLLPENPAVRTGPFFELCSIAECIFDEEIFAGYEETEEPEE